MPRLSEAKKDVTSCEKPRGGANTHRSADIRMGQPGWSDPSTAQKSVGRTRGTETSQYPEEKKTTVIARVAASESAGAQTAVVATRQAGLKDRQRSLQGEVRGTVWKGGSERVKAPYPKTGTWARRHLSSAGHEKSGMNPRGPSRKAKHYRETDSGPVP